MSEAAAPDIWPRTTLPPRAPDIAPVVRHVPPTGLGAFDWRWRHGFARRRIERLLAADATAGIALAVPVDALTRRRADALLRGCYVAMPDTEQEACVAIAAATAAQLGIAVHIACPDAAAAERLRAAVIAATPGQDEAVAGLLRMESLADAAASLTMYPVVCGTLAGFAHAWLRGSGARSVLERAAARLAGDDRTPFGFAPLLLVIDADRELLETVRQPLQLTDSIADQQAQFVHDVFALLDGWQAGEEYVVAGSLTVVGEAALARHVQVQGGLWTVPTLASSTVLAAIRALALQPEVHYHHEMGQFRWLVPTAGIAQDEAEFARIEHALRCRLGIAGSTRTRRRAWLPEFLLGYARLGAAGAALGPEWRDVWWIYGTPVIDNTQRPLDVAWRTLAGLATDTGAGADTVIAFGARSAQVALLPLLGKDLPADAPCLERADDRARTLALVQSGKALWVMGPLVSARHVPPGDCSIILLADGPALPGSLSPWLASLACRVAVRGKAGRWLARHLGQLALSRQAAHQRRLRTLLVERMQQDRKTYAFTGRSRDLT